MTFSQVTNAKYDTLLVPRRVRHTKEEAIYQWLEVELVIKPSPARGRSLRRGNGHIGSQSVGSNRVYSPGAARSGLAGSSGVVTGSGLANSGIGSSTADDVWVVLDVQSYIEGSEGSDNGDASSKSVVRINVCRRRNLDILDPREQRELHPDGALEVVGYMHIRTDNSES
jgi:hypothetical protein